MPHDRTLAVAIGLQTKRGYHLTFDAPVTGVVSVDWYLGTHSQLPADRGGLLLVAGGSSQIRRPGPSADPRDCARHRLPIRYRTYIFYHALAQPDPDHASAARYLFSSPIRWAGLGGYDPMIGSGQVDLRTAHRLAPPALVRAPAAGRHRTARASGHRQRSASSHSTMRAPISAPASS